MGIPVAAPVAGVSSCAAKGTATSSAKAGRAVRKPDTAGMALLDKPVSIRLSAGAIHGLVAPLGGTRAIRG